MATQAEIKAQIEARIKGKPYAHVKAEYYEPINAAWDKASAELNAFIKAQGPTAVYPNGLTCDRVKAMPEYRALRLKCEQAGEKAKLFNAVFTRIFKKEHAQSIADARNAKWAALCA